MFFVMAFVLDNSDRILHTVGEASHSMGYAFWAAFLFTTAVKSSYFNYSYLPVSSNHSLNLNVS